MSPCMCSESCRVVPFDQRCAYARRWRGPARIRFCRLFRKIRVHRQNPLPCTSAVQAVSPFLQHTRLSVVWGICHFASMLLQCSRSCGLAVLHCTHGPRASLETRQCRCQWRCSSINCLGRNAPQWPLQSRPYCFRRRRQPSHRVRFASMDHLRVTQWRRQ